MKNILSQASREVLEQFVWSNVLLAFDYDGTLSPIVAQPQRAMMRERTRGLLEEVTELYPVIVISGRAQGDVMKRLRGLGVREIIGNHGIEPWHAAEPLMDEVQRWRPAIEKKLARFRGVNIEDKIFSIAIHYRHSREKKRARAAILRAAAALDEVRVIGGKQVVNLLPRRAPHKGIALERERQRLGCDTAIYVGDDETDEDVFALDQPGRLLTVRVGAKRGSQANYCLRGQPEMDEFLRLLIELRRRVERQRQALR